MRAEKVDILNKPIQKEKIVKSLISSFRIENIHISQNDAAKILNKVENRIKKQVL